MKSSSNILVVALSCLSYQQTYLLECEFLGNGRLVNVNAFRGSEIMFRNNVCVMHEVFHMWSCFLKLQLRILLHREMMEIEIFFQLKSGRIATYPCHNVEAEERVFHTSDVASKSCCAFTSRIWSSHFLCSFCKFVNF